MPRTNKKSHSYSKKSKKNLPGRQLDYKRKGRLAYEGKTSRKELKRIKKYSHELDQMLRNHDDLPEWVQDKVTTAEDRLRSAFEYIDYKLHRMKVDGKIVTESKVRKLVRNHLRSR